MSNWIECGLPYGHARSGENCFAEKAAPIVGLIIETEYGQHLIGHINELRGTCDDCREFGPETVVLRYKRVCFL
jgi:hypothetical protein